MSKYGLSRQRWIDPIDSFVREFGRSIPERWAVICTYECDFQVLERRILPSLNRRGRAFRTLVLADARALEDRLSVSRPFRDIREVVLLRDVLDLVIAVD
jgi:hypothetical protein